MSATLTLNLDLKKLYKELCDNCKKKLLKILKESIDDKVILRAIGITGEE